MKRTAISLAAFFISSASLLAQQAEIVSVEKIWDKAKHNAFTDLARFKNLFICSFREGDDHIGGDGQVRVLISSSGKNWVEQAVVSESGVDLRDPKLTVAPPELLMLTMGGSIYKGTKTLQGRQPRIATSTDFKSWSPNVKALSSGDALWRTTWHETEKKFYGVAYNQYPNTGGPAIEKEWSAKVYSSADGKIWALVSVLNVPGQPNEATIRFKPDGTGVTLIRRDGGDKRGMIGTAKPPYREWTWNPLPYSVTGPNFIVLPDGSMVACTIAGTRLGLFKMTDTALEPLLPLQSGGDCGYAGLVWEDGLLHVTYHSSHEGKASIYYARVKLPWVK